MTTLGQTELAHLPPFGFGGLVFAPAASIVSDAAGRTEPLQPQAMRVLIALVEADGATLSRNDLRRLCWHGRTVGDDAVDRVIARIRRIEDVLGPAFALETIPKVGYRLVATPLSDDLRPDDLPPGDPVPVDPVPGAVAPPEVRYMPSRRTLLTGGAILAGAAIGGTVLVRGGRATAAGLHIAVGPITVPAGDRQAGAVAQDIVHQCRIALARIDGVALVETAADPGNPIAHAARAGADHVVSGNAGSAGNYVRLGLDLATTEPPQLIATTTRLIAASARSVPQRQTVGALIEKVAGLVDPAQVLARGPRYPRDPVAVRQIEDARRLLAEAREHQMIGRDAECGGAANGALALVRQAQAIDPRDPVALVTLAALMRNGWPSAFAAQPRTAMQRVGAAREYVRSALTFDPNDPTALAAVADDYRRYEWRWHEAENLLRRAIDTDPVNIDAHWSYAYLLGTQGRAIEGLRHARRLQELAPDYAWRRVSMPRLLYLAGHRDSALARYRIELRRAPTNAFLIREVYFVFLSEGNADGLRDLIDLLGSAWRGREPPGAIMKLMQRARAGAAAVTGQPEALRAIVTADLAAYDAPRLGPRSTQQGRASIDLAFVFAMEFAWAGDADQAIVLLDRALASRSLYWPACLPYGPAEFPAIVRQHPRYAALWTADPRLADLVAIRRRAIETGQMVGVRPDGVRVRSLRRV